jgi:hypothetical protein
VRGGVHGGVRGRRQVGPPNPSSDGVTSMRDIVIAKMFVLTLLGLYLAIGLTQPTGQGGSATRTAVALASGAASARREQNGASQAEGDAIVRDCIADTASRHRLARPGFPHRSS